MMMSDFRSSSCRTDDARPRVSERENRSRFSSFRFHFTCDRSEDWGCRASFWLNRSRWHLTCERNLFQSKDAFHILEKRFFAARRTCVTCVWFMICHLSSSRHFDVVCHFLPCSESWADCHDRRHPAVQLVHDKNVSTNSIRETRSLYVLWRSLDISAINCKSLEKKQSWKFMCEKLRRENLAISPKVGRHDDEVRESCSRRRTQFT